MGLEIVQNIGDRGNTRIMARPRRATKEKGKMGKGKMENKKWRKQKRRNKKMEEQEGRGKKKKRGKQETTGSIRKQQVRVRKREETNFARAISVQTARCLSALPKVISLCVAPLRLRKPDHGPQGVECRQGIKEADFDGSSSAVDEVAAQRVPAPNERLQQNKVSGKDRANSGLSRSLRLPQQPQARV